MPKHLRLGLAASLIAFASPAFAAVGDLPLTVVPADQRLTLLRVLADAKPVVQVVLAGLVLALAAALLLWLLQLVRIGRRRSDGAAGVMAFLSALGAAGPLIGLFGAAYGLLDMFIGVANVRPTPSLSILAPGLAEAALCVCLGLLAAAVAVIAQRHLKARLYASERQAAAAVPAPLAGAAG
jgi:hypothetical protein